jgi:hypothetical protein
MKAPPGHEKLIRIYFLTWRGFALAAAFHS